MQRDGSALGEARQDDPSGGDPALTFRPHPVPKLALGGPYALFVLGRIEVFGTDILPGLHFVP